MATIDAPWAIVLCKFSDKPVEHRTPAFYLDFYATNGMGGACDYWRAVSSNALDLTRSRVFGWLTMTHASTEVLPSTGRRVLAQWGFDTANASGVDLSPFMHVLVVMNWGLTAPGLPDHGDVGPMGSGSAMLLVDQDPAVCEFGFICHEMGHGFGLNHSWSANPDTGYGDGWDLMSFDIGTQFFSDFPIGFEGARGTATVGLNAHNLESLGALPGSRLWAPASPDFSETVSLDALNQPPIGNHGYLVAKIPAKATSPARSSGSDYTVEMRRPSGWDQATPKDAIVIHEVRSDGLSYLQPTSQGSYGTGQQFVTPDPHVYVRVVDLGSPSSGATVRVWDLPDGSLRKEDSDQKVYLIDHGAKRWVTAPGVLAALGKSWADVRVVPDGALSAVPLGPDVRLLKVTVSPYPVPVGRSVLLAVVALDSGTGAPVAGQVIVDGKAVGVTKMPNTAPFPFTAHTSRKLIPGTLPREFEVIYPSGVVVAGGYPNAPIDFGFPDV